MTIKCSVEGCQNKPEFEVRLYDRYSDGYEFDERDFTCPFLCGQHKEENEAKAIGQRGPRASVQYPYSNQQCAQGFSTYRPLKKAA